uniref:GNAT family N-acetyltransferase n=1 Tax=Polaribacter sp. TaxID=1920175 RepID=UPI004048B773
MILERFNKNIDLEGQRNLFNECFPENKGTSVETEAHYLWKFHSFPDTPPSYEYAAYLKDKLIGYYAALPYNYIIGDSSIKVGMVCDVMTGVEARGKGVFTKMGVYATDSMKDLDLDFTIGYPIRPEVIPGHIKAGWEKLFALPLYINLLSSKGFLKNKKVGFLYPLFDVFLTFYSLLLGLFKGKGNYRVNIVDSTDLKSINGLDLFYEKWVGEQKIALNKSVEFLNWRLGAPGKTYKIIVARNAKEIVGISIVTKIIRENVPSIALLELCSLNGYKNVETSLFDKIRDYAKEQKQEAIMIMASHFFSKKYKLIKNGFIKTPYKFWLIIKNLKRTYSMDFLADENNWSLTWIDSDDL